MPTKEQKAKSDNNIKKDLILKIENLTKKFGKKQVLKGINLEVKRGEFLAIIGSNGAGKTTLIEIIAQTLKKTTGKITYNFKNKKNPKKAIGIQFQEGNWPAGLSAQDIINFFRGSYNHISKEKIKDLSETFEIGSFIKKGLNKLSGGQKQRINALLAVLHGPELIGFDEITTGLDVQLQYKILKFIKAYWKAKKPSIILVSHGPEEIEVLAKRVVLIHDGYIYADYKMSEIKTEFGSVRKMINLYFDHKLKSNTVYRN